MWEKLKNSCLYCYSRPPVTLMEKEEYTNGFMNLKTGVSFEEKGPWKFLPCE